MYGGTTDRHAQPSLQRNPANLRRSVDDHLRERQRLLEFAEELQRAGRGDLTTK
jgi:hypothetical protein